MNLLPNKNVDVVFKVMSDGTAVLLSTKSEIYYGLNLVGAQIWELLPPQLNTTDELCLALQKHYPDIEPATLRSDVLELLEDLAEEGLVQRRDNEPKENDSKYQCAKSGES